MRTIWMSVVLAGCLGMLNGPPVLAEADGPDAWKVGGVQPGSGLRLRRGPSTDFGVVTVLPHNAVQLSNLGCTPEFTIADWERFTEPERKVAAEMRWCRVRYHSDIGWVAGRYLDED